MTERKKEREQYQGDVEYEIWRRGGNLNRINYDRLEDHFYNYDSVDKAAADELKRQSPAESGLD